MTGLKSGAGDDLWGDDGDTAEEDTAPTEDESMATETAASDDTASTTITGTNSANDTTVSASESTSETQSYIIRRAIQDKSVQFERDERLTFFVHDDVITGERDLITEVESTLGRNVPKFDVREAVYRAALRNRDDILDELLKMGYSSETN
jgi:hypothetical protein